MQLGHLELSFYPFGIDTKTRHKLTRYLDAYGNLHMFCTHAVALAIFGDVIEKNHRFYKFLADRNCAAINRTNH